MSPGRIQATHAISHASDYPQVMTSSVRVSEATRARASALAAASGHSIGELVDRALDAYERSLFWEETRRALASGEARPDDEDRAWDRTSRDGFDRE